MDKIKFKSSSFRKRFLKITFGILVFLSSSLFFSNKAHAQVYGKDTAFVSQNGNTELWEQVFETHLALAGGADILLARDTYFYATDADNNPIAGDGYYTRESGGIMYDSGTDSNENLRDYMDVAAMEMGALDVADWIVFFDNLGLDPGDFGLE